jgi:two-component system response regulator HydG
MKDSEVLATLNVESDIKNAFDENDVITLEAVAAQVSVAITNRRLFKQVKDFSKDLQKAVDTKTLELREAQDRILAQQKLLQRENQTLKSLVQGKTSVELETIGKSPSILSIMTMVDKIAPTTATVLIQGESGTGKELVARRLHFKSERAEKPFVTVNCGALQESLLESEIFGHEKGSFTGAVVQKIGLAETADGGTLFLDEIGEMSLSIQAKFLRFLQEGEFYRIGGKRPIKVNVRVVSATNRDLEQEVRESRFREDLFYRLNTITLRMPPLRERRTDIPLLFDYFLKNSRFGGSTQQIRRVDPRVTEVFMNYDWPGNIRELQNTIERLKILADNNEIKLDDIPFNIRSPKTRLDSGSFNVELSLDEVEKNHILRALAYHDGNKTKTAQSLGITIKTLYNKLHRYGLLPSAVDSEKAPNDKNDEQLSG